MEVVAAAASIAGIITLAAQAIDGLQKLHAFFLDISSASKAVGRLLSDINSLISVLHNIDNVLGQAETQRRNQNFAQLDIKVEDCTKDVRSWLEIAKTLRSGDERGGRSWVRRARLAGKGEVVSRIRDEIGRHRQALCLSLAVFGRSVISLFVMILDVFHSPLLVIALLLDLSLRMARMIDQEDRTIDLHTSEQIYQMRGRMDDALSTSLSSHGVHEQALRRIEQYSISSMRSSVHSLQSMDSIRTELSRLEAMITSTHGASTTSIEHPEARLPIPPKDANSQSLVHDNTVLEQPTSPVSGKALEPSSTQLSHRGSSSASHYSSEASSARPPGEHKPINIRTHPADFHRLVKEQEDISKRFSEISSGHESALLYAQFSRSTPPPAKASNDEPTVIAASDSDPNASRGADIITSPSIDQIAAPQIGKPRDKARTSDSGIRHQDQPERMFDEMNKPSPISSRQWPNPAGSRKSPPSDDSSRKRDGLNSRHSNESYQLLQQCLIAAYPPVIADFIMIQDLVVLYENHTLHLENRPSVIHDTSHGEVDTYLRTMRDRLEALQEASDNAARACIDCGYSKSDLEGVCASSGSIRQLAHSGAYKFDDLKTKTSTSVPVVNSDDIVGSSGDDSDTYFSSAE